MNDTDLRKIEAAVATFVSQLDIDSEQLEAAIQQQITHDAIARVESKYQTMEELLAELAEGTDMAQVNRLRGENLNPWVEQLAKNHGVI